MELTIVSPEKTLFSGSIDRIIVPGKKGQFEVLENHAPIISSLVSGSIVFKSYTERSLDIKAGFIEVNSNVVTVCVEQ